MLHGEPAAGATVAKRRDKQAEAAKEAQRRDEARAAEYDRHQREWNRERGELARNLGTLVEDIVSPSVPRVISDLFGITEEQIERHGIRQRVRRAGRGREFDVVTLFPAHALIVESKTQLKPETCSQKPRGSCPCSCPERVSTVRS